MEWVKILHFLQKHYTAWHQIDPPYIIDKATFEQFLYIFIDIGLKSVSAHTDKQISVTEGRLVSGQDVFHNL